MSFKRLYVLLLMLIFILPVIAATGWEVSELVYLSSRDEEEGHIGFGISELVLLSSMEEDLGHIGEGISNLVYLSSMSEEANHVGFCLSEQVLLSSMEEDLGHIGEGISNLVLLSSMNEELNHIGECISLVTNLSSLHYGDVDFNAVVESFDASLVLQYFCQMEPEGVPLPWEDWRQEISDVDGNIAIEAYDASLILQYAVDMIDTFPVEEEPAIRKEVRLSTTEGTEGTEKEKTVHFRRK